MTVVQDIKGRADIVELVSDYVPLEKSGRNLKANCPFHSENTPSFIVFPDKQTWRCFGACASGGDIISFVMKIENEEFGQALARLSQKTGIPLPTRTENNRSDKIYEINNEALQFFRNVLNSQDGTSAKNYIAKRGIDSETESNFQLGYSPNGREMLTRHLLNIGFQKNDIVDSGLTYSGKDGGVRDLFSHRIMFPILDGLGRVVGFGGRTLDNSNPKYLNTPKTTVFDKSKILYGFSLGKEQITKSDAVIVVEGYMDVIAAHQMGYKNVVAQMGTALTEHQVYILKSSASNFILALDPDEAGKEATLRSLESSWQALQINILRTGRGSRTVFSERKLATALKIATLPPGKDPDTLIREDLSEWERSITEAQSLLDYLLDVLPYRFDITRDEGKLRLLETFSPFIRSEKNPFSYNKYLNKLSAILSVEGNYIEKQIWDNKNLRATQKIKREPNSLRNPYSNKNKDSDPLEEYCIYLLVNYPELRSTGMEIPCDYFELSENRDIFTKWLECSNMDDIVEGASIYISEHLGHIRETENPPLDIKERQKSLEEIIKRFEERFFKFQEQALLDRLEGTDWKNIAELEESLTQSNKINQKLKELFAKSNHTNI